MQNELDFPKRKIQTDIRTFRYVLGAVMNRTSKRSYGDGGHRSRWRRVARRSTWWRSCDLRWVEELFSCFLCGSFDGRTARRLHGDAPVHQPEEDISPPKHRLSPFFFLKSCFAPFLLWNSISVALNLFYWKDQYPAHICEWIHKYESVFTGSLALHTVCWGYCLLEATCWIQGTPFLLHF